MPETNWSDCYSKPEIDGHKIDLQFIHVGAKVSNTVYKASTTYKDTFFIEEEFITVTKYGSTMADAVANLLNYIVEVVRL